MANLAVIKYIAEKKFPARDQYLSFRGTFKSNIKNKISFFNDYFNNLFRKTKEEQEVLERIKKYNLMMKKMEEKKKKKMKLKMDSKLKLILKHKKIQSYSNNKMILDLMLKSKSFIDYINESKDKKDKKAVKVLSTNNLFGFKDNSSKIKKRNLSSPFLTEIKYTNMSHDTRGNKIYSNKKNKNKLKYNLSSTMQNFTGKGIGIKPFTKKYKLKLRIV